MKLKKIISTALAGVMALSLTATAFAVDADSELTRNLDIAGTTKAPTIKIVVPSSGAVTVNPYQMEVTVGSDKVTDQIISTTQYVENKSDVAIQVSAAITGKVEGAAKLVTTSTQGGKTAATANNVYLVFESTVVDDNTTAPVWTGDGAVAAEDKVEVKVSTTKATKDLGTLAKGDGTDAGAADGYLAFHLTGDAVKAPTKAWTEADKVSASIAFTFVPTVVEAG